MDWRRPVTVRCKAARYRGRNADSAAGAAAAARNDTANSDGQSPCSSGEASARQASFATHRTESRTSQAVRVASAARTLLRSEVKYRKRGSHDEVNGAINHTTERGRRPILQSIFSFCMIHMRTEFELKAV